MNIIRKVYCQHHYEGLYQLVAYDNEYFWEYIWGTAGNDSEELDYPTLHADDRTQKRAAASYKIGAFFPFKEGNLWT